jgi:hypothetical protein
MAILYQNVVLLFFFLGGKDSLVGIETGYVLGGPGFESL